MLSTLVVITLAPPLPVAAGNAGFHFSKTVGAAAISPVLTLTLATDKGSAIPGDPITYSGTVSNTGDSWTLTGQLTAQSHQDATATVASWWDELQYCLTGCGDGLNQQWTNLAGASGVSSGYTPIEQAPPTAGMHLDVVPTAAAGVVYPATGDLMLGTSIDAGAQASWSYTARVALTPDQAALLSDPSRVQAVRNVAHLETLDRNTKAAQPWTDSAAVSDGFQASTTAGAATGVVVKVTEPGGAVVTLDSSVVRGFAAIAPGRSVPYATHFQVPVPAARATAETDSTYVQRLTALEGSALTASAALQATGSAGPATAPAPPPVTTVEHLPVLGMVKSGPTAVDAGTTESNGLAISNGGGAPASALAVTDTVPGGATGTVTGVPSSLAAGASANAAAAFPVPSGQPAGPLTDTAALTWQDANANLYGPVSSSFTTRVNNAFAGATLTLSPAQAGPNKPGTSQALTAKLLDAAGAPMPNRPLTFTVTGANPGTGGGTTDANGLATFTYVGVNAGNDVAQAAVAVPGVNLSSNTSSISWVSLLQPVGLTPVTGNFFANPGAICTFGVGPGSQPVFGQQFPDILFNATPQQVPHDISNVTQATRPFTDLTTDVNGNFNGTIPAQDTSGNLAGVGALGNFFAELTGTFLVQQAGDVSFTITHDDGYLLGVGGGATRVSGAYEGSPPSTTPFLGYPTVAAFNQGTVPVDDHDTIHFPAAGSYPFELDYTECGGTQLTLVMQLATFTAQTSPLSVYVGYADGLRPAGSIFPFPWFGSPNVTFVGSGTFDSGALRFDNSGDTPITFDSVTVDVGNRAHYDIWPHSLLLPAHQILILAQTNGENFDSSDVNGTGCGQDSGIKPTVNVTIAGHTTTFADSGEVLNTHGYDTACQGNESTSWTRIGGGGTAINVPLPPAATLNLSPFNVPNALQGQVQNVTVAAMDGSGNPVANLALTLQVFGANARTLTGSTDASGLAHFSYTGGSPGTDSLLATGFVSGLREVSNTGIVLWTPPAGGGYNPGPNPNPNAPPAPSISAPSIPDGATVTQPTAITATVTPPSGQTITGWRVFYQALDPGAPVVIGSGSGAPPSPPASLATFDPTVLANDAYAITVEATASGGGIQDVSSSVRVLGNLKPGRFTEEFQDLAVPVNGFQMEVRRSYDSFDSSSGDFGKGWKVDVVNFRVAPNRELGAGGWSMYNTQCFFGLCNTAYKNSAQRYVNVVFPDQHTEQFDLTPTGGTNLFWSCTPVFTARAGSGTNSTLVALDDTGCSYTGDGNLYGSSGIYDPHRFKLTTAGGSVLVLDRTLGLISESDPSGNSLTIDSTGIHASNGQSVTFTRNAGGLITSIGGPGGQTVAYGYDAAGNLSSVVDVNGNTTTFSYNATQTLTGFSGPSGPLQTQTYDAGGRLTAITDGLGNVTSISNDVAGLQQTLLDPAGRLTTVLHFDALGDVVQTDRIAGGHKISSSATFDGVGHELTATDPLGNVRHNTYDAGGNLVSFRDGNGTLFNFAYNANNLITSVSSGGQTLATYTYDAAGNLVHEQSPDCASCDNTYDGAGHVVTHTSGTGGVTRYTYDSAGHMSTVTNPNGGVYKLTTDSSGRPTSIQDAAGQTSSFTYDSAGRTLSQTDANHHTRSASFDFNGHILSSTDPLGASTRYTYDAAGRLSSETDRNGAVTSFSYDADGNLLTETLPGGDTTSRTYDGFGRLTEIANSAAVVDLTWDDAGHLASSATSGTATDALPTTSFAYTYDGIGDRLSSAGPDGTIANVYNSLGQLTQLTDTAGGVFTLGVDNGMRLTSLARPNGVRDDMTYDTSGDLLSRTSSLSGATVTQSMYTYTAAREAATVTNGAGAANYTYDSLLRLSGASRSSGNESYTFDAASNRIAAQNALGSSTYTYDAGDRLLSDSHFNYSWDAEGNLVSKVDRSSHATTSYTYNARHQLLSVQSPTATSSYRYDPFGRRVSVTVNGVTTRYAYDGDNIRLEYDGGNTLQASYTMGVGIDTPLEMRRGGAAYYYAVDGLGSVTALIDSKGAIAAGYSYDTYGNQTSTGGVVNPFTFTGREYDSATGLYYYRARYYDPTTGRFLSEDPVPAMNPYVYAADAPTAMTDPSGTTATELAIRFIIIGAIAGALSSAITTALLECEYGCFDWRDVLVAALAGAIGGAITNAATLACGWICGGALGGAAQGGLQDLGQQAVHKGVDHIDGSEVLGFTAIGAGSGVVAGGLGGGDLGVTSVAGGYYRNALGQFAEKPGVIDSSIPATLIGLFGGAMEGARSRNLVCPS